MHVLSLQAWFGGSHRAFQSGWQEHSCHQWTVLSLPPRHWKWRMRHSALYFSEVAAQELAGHRPDAILCTDFLNVAEFRGLAPASLADLPLVLYFHENQFAYPVRHDDPRDLHFAFTNLISAVAADEIWFNSRYNRDSFLESADQACQRWPDYSPASALAALRDRSCIQPPGIHTRELTCPEPLPAGRSPIRLVWAARWEHDKNPALLLESLQQLRQRNVDFRISIIGETFTETPPEFARIQEQFRSQIDHWGFLADRQSYCQALQQADVFVSTADHEFFGIAAAEAIVAGAWPLLPDRLAYPELVAADEYPANRRQFLYDGSATHLAEKVEYIAGQRTAEQTQLAMRALQTTLQQRLDWEPRAAGMDERIGQLARRHADGRPDQSCPRGARER